jgi:F-type H+-transporting ATPase subunit b
MQIDWWTFGLQAINFLVLVWLLSRFLYQPIRRVIEQRRKLAEEAFAEADKRKAEADKTRQQFEQDRAALARERQETLNQAHEALDRERQRILSEARTKADELLDDARANIAREREQTFAQIRSDIANAAAAIATGLLEQRGAARSGNASIEAICQRIEKLGQEERRRLDADLEDNGGTITVVTATPLASEERQRWVEQLRAKFGERAEPSFVIDSDILGGAELRFPHAVLKFTWAEHLRQATERMREHKTAS